MLNTHSTSRFFTLLDYSGKRSYINTDSLTNLVYALKQQNGLIDGLARKPRKSTRSLNYRTISQHSLFDDVMLKIKTNSCSVGPPERLIECRVHI